MDRELLEPLEFTPWLLEYLTSDVFSRRGFRTSQIVEEKNFREKFFCHSASSQAAQTSADFRGTNEGKNFKINLRTVFGLT